MSETEGQDVGQETAIVKTGSSSDMTSFDELEAVMMPKQSKVDKNLGVEKGEKSKKKDDDLGDDDGDQQSETKDIKKLDPKAKAKGEKDDSALKTKTYKVKNGETDVELAGNTLFKSKIDGKEENVDLDTLLTEYSGKTQWRRKFQELDTERKTFHTEREELQSSVDTLHRLAITENKPMEAVAFLTDLLGGDGIKLVQKMQEQMITEFESLSKLTPEQRQAKSANERANLLEAKIKNETDAKAKMSEKSQVEARIDKVKTKYGMTEERFGDIYSILKKNGTPANELTPEFVGEVHERWLQMDQSDEVVEELGFPSEDLLKIKQSLYEEWKKDPSLTKEQIKAIAQQVFKPGKKGSSLRSKMERSNINTPTSKTGNAKPNYEAINFDDL